MKDTSRNLEALRRIRACLNEQVNTLEAAYLDELILFGESSDVLENLSLQSAVKDNKYLWGGMGTLPDTVSIERGRIRDFTDAYIDLAQACQDLNLESEYSKRALETLREWRKKGLA